MEGTGGGAGTPGKVLLAAAHCQHFSTLLQRQGFFVTRLQILTAESEKIHRSSAGLGLHLIKQQSSCEETPVQEGSRPGLAILSAELGRIKWMLLLVTVPTEGRWVWCFPHVQGCRDRGGCWAGRGCQARSHPRFPHSPGETPPWALPGLGTRRVSDHSQALYPAPPRMVLRPQSWVAPELGAPTLAPLPCCRMGPGCQL